jgi:hypothetical protein
MKWLALVLIAIGAATASLLPSPVAPDPDLPSPTVSPPISVCPVEEGSGRSTQITVLSSLVELVDMTVFGAGADPPTLQMKTGASGAMTVQSADLEAVGRVAALTETHDASSAAGVTVTGTESIAGESCFRGNPGAQTFVAGGATTEGNEFDLQLMNPYSGEAVVDLVVQSESGRETNERFGSVVVPAKGSVVFDFTRLIPGRNSVTVTVEPVSGAAWVAATQRRGGENASWRAVEAAADWYLPIPSGLAGHLHLATPVNDEVDYQVDLYGPEGLLETWQSGTLPARGQASIDLGELTGLASAVHIVSRAPLVPTLWLGTAETGLAVTTGSPVQAGSWLLPGAGAPAAGSGALVMVNTGVDPTVARVRAIRGTATESEFQLPVDAVVEVPLALAEAYRVDTDGSVVVMWVARRGGAAMAAMGVPLDGG